jgi:hypothetical protein
VNSAFHTDLGVDLDALSTWMTERNLGCGPITDIEPLTGGTQNITLRLIRDGRAYIFRRPPLSKR